MILVDSSVWIDYFRGGKTGDKVDLLLEHNLVATCGLILAELVPFLKVRNQRKLIKLLQLLPNYDDSPNWQDIIKYQTICLQKGVTGIGLADLILLDISVRNDLAIFSLDRHFDKLHELIDFNLFY